MYVFRLGAGKIVAVAVDLEDQLRALAGKVSNGWTDRRLATDMMPGLPEGLEDFPELALRRSLVEAELSRQP